MSQSELIKRTGINKGSLSSYLNGRYEPKQKAIYKLSKALNVSEAWLMGYDVPMERALPIIEHDNKIPLYSSISCGTGLFVDDNVEDYIAVPDKYIKKGIEYFANTASGDSMIGKGIKDGDVLVFEKTNVLNNGEIGSFCLDLNEAVCKVFRKLPNGMIVLESANDKYDPIVVDLTDETCFRIVGRYKFKFSIEQK